MAFIVLYLIVDVFERLSFLVKNDASVRCGGAIFSLQDPADADQIMPRPFS